MPTVENGHIWTWNEAEQKGIWTSPASIGSANYDSHYVIKDSTVQQTMLARLDLPDLRATVIYENGQALSSRYQANLGYTPENVTNKGVANGYASLDATGKVPTSQLPASSINQWTDAVGGICYLNGNVGVGTQTPAYKLSVAGDVSGYVARFKGINYAGVANITLDNTDGRIDYYAQSALHQFNGSITATGNFAGVGFTGSSFSTVGGSNGHVSLQRGDTYTGFFAWHSSSGVRQGYMGYDASGVAYHAEVGNFGIYVSGSNLPTYLLDVGGKIRSSTGGFVFPDNTTQTTAATGGTSSQWLNNGTSIYYTTGNVGIGGNGSPATQLDVTGVLRVRTAIPGSYMNLNGGAINAKDNLGAAAALIINQNGGNTLLNLQSGYVLIGTNMGSSKLTVAGYIESTAQGFKFPDGTTQTTAASGSGSQWTTSGSNIYYNTGNVGIGMTPTAPLSIQAPLGVSAASVLVATNNSGVYYEAKNIAGKRWWVGVDVNVVGDGLFTIYDVNNGLSRITINPTNGNVGLSITPSYPLHLASGAHCTVGGVWTNASSRALKNIFGVPAPERAWESAQQLTVYEYAYKNDGEKIRHMTPVAEEFHGLTGLGDDQSISAADLAGFGLSSMKGFSKQVNKRFSDATTQVAALQERITALEAQLKSQTKRG